MTIDLFSYPCLNVERHVLITSSSECLVKVSGTGVQMREDDVSYIRSDFPSDGLISYR